MSDDWRLRVDLHAEGAAHELLEHLAATRLEHDLSASFHDRVVVSRDGAELFCYAGTRDQAEHAERLIGSLAAEHGWRADTELKRWHAMAEDWEDPDRPLPQSDSDQAGERAALMEREREESAQLGYLEWEVRIECPSHHDAVEFAERLRSEGVANLRRSHHLLIGATDEDSAQALATRVGALAPAGSTVAVEATQEAAYAELPPNPFVIFGGLGG